MLDLHSKNRTLPRCKKKLGEINRVELVSNLAIRLCLCDAFGKRRTPFQKNRSQPLTQHLAMLSRLQTEISNQTTTRETIRGEAFGDDVQVTS